MTSERISISAPPRRSGVAVWRQMCVECVDVDPQGRPIKYGETVFCGDRVQLVVAMADTP